MRKTRALLGALLLLLVVVVALVGPACRTGSPAAAPVEPATLSSARAAESPSLKARMRGHAAHGAAVRDAVARADFDVARAEAKALAELAVDTGLAPALRKDLDAMNAAAARVAGAGDIGEASHELAALASTCGDCHATLGGPATVVGEPPDDDFAVLPRMKRHEWAVTRLWEGLVGPSDLSWKAGARVLVDAPLEPEQLTPGMSPAPAIGKLARSVHELAANAKVAKAPVDRIAVFGELMTTCASCHQRLGGGPDGAAP
jgi:mono/diheme cytochrome c family protein